MIICMQDKQLDTHCRSGCTDQHSRDSWTRGADWNRRPLQDCSLLHGKTNRYWKIAGEYYAMVIYVLEEGCIGEHVLDTMYWRNLQKTCFFLQHTVCSQCCNAFLPCDGRMSTDSAMDALRTAPPAWPLWAVCSAACSGAVKARSAQQQSWMQGLLHSVFAEGQLTIDHGVDYCRAEGLPAEHLQKVSKLEPQQTSQHWCCPWATPFFEWILQGPHCRDARAKCTLWKEWMHFSGCLRLPFTNLAGHGFLQPATG